MITKSKVKELSVGRNNITSQEVETILFDMMNWLEVLYIHENRLDDHAAKLLSEGIANTKTLRALNIADNNIGPSGTISIVKALTKNTSLEVLYLSNAVGLDVASETATAISNNKKLKELHMGRGQFDEESAMMIINSLYKNNTITKLHLSIRLCESYHDEDMIKYTKKFNSTRKLHNENTVMFYLSIRSPQSLTIVC